MKSSTSAVKTGLLDKWCALLPLNFPTFIRSYYRIFWSGIYGLSAFLDFIPEWLKYALKNKLFLQYGYGLFSHVVLPWSAHLISPVFRGRSCLALNVHPLNRTGRNTCYLFFYTVYSLTLSNLCLEITSKLPQLKCSVSHNFLYFSQADEVIPFNLMNCHASCHNIPLEKKPARHTSVH